MSSPSAPKRPWTDFATDIIDNVRKINRVTERVHSLDEFVADSNEDVRRQVILSLQAIGEAARKINIDVALQELYPKVPWSAMRRLRNELVHRYWFVELDDVWRTVDEEVAVWLREVQYMLDTKGTGDTRK